jgi:hypothetical protein
MNNRLLPEIGFVISALVLLALGETQVALASQGLNFTTIDVPGAGLTAGQGINASGDMVGFYTADAGGLPPLHGYLFARGAFLTIDVPGAMDTAGRGINARGDIVGEYDLDGITEHGYLRRETASPL